MRRHNTAKFSLDFTRKARCYSIRTNNRSVYTRADETRLTMDAACIRRKRLGVKGTQTSRLTQDAAYPS